MKLQTPEELFSQCPQLEDIANRLHDSETAVAEFNKQIQSRRAGNTDTSEGSGHKLTYKTKYPEHCRIAEIYRNGRWERMASLPKPGRDEFLKSLVSVIETRNPKGLKVQIFGGKRITSNPEEFLCYLSTSDVETKEMEAKAGDDSLKGAESKVGNEIITLQNQIAELKKHSTLTPELLQANFEMKITKIQHDNEIEKLIRDYETKLDKKDQQIYDLQDEIEDLQAQLAEQDSELSGAAELINQKQKPPAVQVLLASAIESAAVNLIKNRPKILTDVFGLKQEQIAEIFAEENKQLPVGEKQPSPEASVSFGEDEYKGFEKEHAEAIKNIHAFAKQLTLEQFKKLYTMFLFCCTDKGELHEDHSNKLIALIHTINNEETKTE